MIEEALARAGMRRLVIEFLGSQGTRPRALGEAYAKAAREGVNWTDSGAFFRWLVQQEAFLRFLSRKRLRKEKLQCLVFYGLDVGKLFLLTSENERTGGVEGLFPGENSRQKSEDP